MRLADVRFGADGVYLLEQFRRFDPDRRTGGTAVDASHERQPIAQVALDWIAGRRMRVLAGVRLPGCALFLAEQPRQPSRRAMMLRLRIGTEEIAPTHDPGLARLSFVE